MNNDISKAPAQPSRSNSPARSNPPANNAERNNGNTANTAARNNGNTANTTARNNGNTTVNNGARNNGNTVNSNNTRNNVNVNNNNVNVNRTVVANPVYRGPAWGWNHGAVWAPAGNYWGGGFWGALAIGATSAAIYGSIVNSTTHTTVTSYQVQPESPGSTLLQNYKLQQVQCGPPGLVVIYGPNNSVICANPNGTVAAGEYDLDTQQLSLVNR